VSILITLRTISKDELKQVLDDHMKWLNDEEGGARANLTRADLTRADLTRANLTWANLTRADLTRANLTRANLTRANLTRANLARANLTRANLTRADLTRADLTWADLTRANLTRANLTFPPNLAEAKTDQRFIQINCIGSRKGSTLYCVDTDIIWCGCFTGTLAEFETKVEETHKDNPRYLSEYRAAIVMFKSQKPTC
jgi:hypothetical protein